MLLTPAIASNKQGVREACKRPGTGAFDKLDALESRRSHVINEIKNIEK